MKLTVRVPLEIPPPGRKRKGGFVCSTAVDVEIEDLSPEEIPVAARTVDGRGITTLWLHDGTDFVRLDRETASREQMAAEMSRSLLAVLVNGSDRSAIYPSSLWLRTNQGRSLGVLSPTGSDDYLRALPDIATVRTGLSAEQLDARIETARKIVGSRKTCRGRAVLTVNEPLLENRFAEMGVESGTGSAGMYRRRFADIPKGDRKVWKEQESAYWQYPGKFGFPLEDFDAWREQASTDLGRTPWMRMTLDLAPESVEIERPEAFSLDVRALELDRHIRMALMYDDRLLRNKAGEWRQWLPQGVVNAHMRLEGLLSYDAANGVPAEVEEAFRSLVDHLDAYRQRSRRAENWMFAEYTRMALDQWDSRPLDITSPALAGEEPRP